jgi:hypothetical protein
LPHAADAELLIEQLIFSETAVRERIDNTPGPEVVDNLRVLAQGLERVQLLTGFPVEISSGYRCPELNRCVGGEKTSQHTQGLAADFTWSFTTLADATPPAISISNSTSASWSTRNGCISPSARRRAASVDDLRSTEGYLDGLWDEGGKQIA